MSDTSSDFPPVLWVSAPPGSSGARLTEKLTDSISPQKTQPLKEKNINNYLEIPTTPDENSKLKEVKPLALAAKLLQQNNVLPIFSYWLTFESQLNYLKDEIKNFHALIIQTDPNKNREAIKSNYGVELLNSIEQSDHSPPAVKESEKGLPLKPGPTEKQLDKIVEYLQERDLTSTTDEPDSEEVVDRLKNIGYI